MAWISMERELICERCNGTGYITDNSGKQDVCPICFGLGTYKTSDPLPPLSRSKRDIKKMLIYTLLGLGIYYAVFFYYFIQGDISVTAAIIILIAGHAVAITFIVLYVLFSYVYSA
ncbi:MAG: hypothetical protein M1592_03940 [Candidatus Thermoplasmatota archaeon]|jgi:hypothetical protein|nr:hypothetical protein [Candidatus Thermoplasmatota archaeon]